MKAAEIIHVCLQKGLELREHGGRIQIQGSGQLDPSLKKNIKAQYRALLRLLAAQDRQDAVRRLPAPETAHKDKTVLSPYQRGFYALSRESAHNITGINQVGVFDLFARPERQHLDSSFNKLLDYHTILRTAFFSPLTGEPYQQITHTAYLTVDYVQPGFSDHQSYEETINKIVCQYNTTPFDLERDPLIKATLVAFDDNHAALIVGLHHIIIDGWSVGVLMDHWMQILTAVTSGKEPLLPELPYQYGQYAEWACNVLLPAISQSQTEYWRKKLSGVPELHRLPTDHLRQPAMRAESSGGPVSVTDKDIVLVRSSFPAETFTRLRAWAAANGCSVFSALYTALRITLQRSGSDGNDSILTVSANREQPAGMENSVGLFINVVPLFCRLNPEDSIRKTLLDGNETLFGALENQNIPFSALVDGLKKTRNRAWHPVGQILLMLQNAFDADKNEMISPRLSPDPITEYELSLLLWDYGKQGTFVHLEYEEGLYDKQSMKMFLDLFVRVCARLPDYQDIQVENLPLHTMNPVANPGHGAKQERIAPISLQKQLQKINHEFVLQINQALRGLHRVAAQYFSAQDKDKLLVVWAGGNSSHRLVLQTACIAHGISFALFPEAKLSSHMLHDMLPQEKNCLVVLEAPEDHTALNSFATGGHKPASWQEITREGQADSAETVSTEGQNSLTRKNPEIWIPDGMGLTRRHICTEEQLLEAVGYLQQTVFAKTPGNLQFILGEDVDQTGLIGLAALLSDISIVWKQPDAVSPESLLMTTSLEAALKQLDEQGACCLVNHLPPSGVMARHQGTLQKGALLLRIPGTLHHAVVNGDHDRQWRGDELYCHASVPEQCLPKDAVEGEMRILGNAVAARIITKDVIALPMPGTYAPHIWRDGLSLNLDTLSAEFTPHVNGIEAVLGFATPESAAETDSLLAAGGEMTAWVSSLNPQENIENLFKHLPGCIQPEHIIPITNIPRMLTGQPDRQVLSRLPILTRSLIDRMAQVTASESKTAVQVLLEQNQFAETRLNKFISDHTYGSIYPGNSLMPKETSNNAPGNDPGLLLTQTSSSLTAMLPVIRSAAPVPDWEAPFAEDRYCVVINSCGKRGEQLLDMILQNSKAKLLVLEQATENLKENAFISDNARVARCHTEYTKPQSIKEALNLGKEHFGIPAGGLLHLLEDYPTKPEAASGGTPDREIGELNALPTSVTCPDQAFHELFPEAVSIWTVLGEGEASQEQSVTIQKNGFAGPLFDKLVESAAQENNRSAHSRLCFFLPAWTADGDAPAQNNLESNAQVQTGVQPKWLPLTITQAFSALLAGLQSGCDTVLAGVNLQAAVNSGHAHGHCHPVQQLTITVPKGADKPVLLHPLSIGAGQPTPVRIIENESTGAKAAHAVAQAVPPSQQNVSHAAIAGKLTAIWSRILDTPDPDPDGNFFDLGGNSLLVPQVRDSILHEFGVDIGMVGVFRHSSLNELLAVIMEQMKAAQSALETKPAQKASEPAAGVSVGPQTPEKELSKNDSRYESQRNMRKQRRNKHEVTI